MTKGFAASTLTSLTFPLFRKTRADGHSHPCPPLTLVRAPGPPLVSAPQGGLTTGEPDGSLCCARTAKLC